MFLEGGGSVEDSEDSEQIWNTKQKDFAILRWALPFFQPTFNLYVAVDDSAVYKPPPDFEKEEKEREAKKRKKKAAPKKK